jgi:serine/threonine protein kinase
MLDVSLPGGGCPACLWGGLIADGLLDGGNGELPEVEGYTIRREIGRGGMGVVYQAMQHRPAREVALKIVAPNSLRAASQRLRFLLEIEAMASVSHPALLPLYESGEDDDGRPWFSMRLASGGTLAERLDRYAGEWRMAAALMVRLGEAVQFSHERGILHRDLKPGNVLFDEMDQAFVADFGLAKWADDEIGLTRSTEMLGSPAYLAPENAAGGAKATTTATDVYGLGAIFYELLTGHTLYKGETSARILSQILNEAPATPRQRMQGIPRDLEIITLKAIAREPGKRYESAAAMVEDIRLWMAGQAIKARAVGQWERLGYWARRNPTVASLAGLLAVSVITSSALLWRSNQRLRLSLDDAEARVEFMTHELPASLEPIGRLDLLDSVFQNVSEHYELSQNRDAVSLARQADFLSQWAQILRPRGQDRAAIERLEQAMIKAREATAGSRPPRVAVHSRVNTGRRLGEALIEGRRLDEAGSVLQETAGYLASQDGDDETMRILDAEVSTELAFLADARNDYDQIVSQAGDALRKWNALLPVLERPPISPKRQRSLVSMLTLHGLLGLHGKDANEAASRRESWKEMSERFVNLVPDNAHFRSLLVVANLRMIGREGLEKEQVRLLLTDTEEQVAALISIDGSNTRWLTDAVASAEARVSFAARNQQLKEAAHWRRVMSQRLDALCKTPSTDLRYLTAQAEYSIRCAKLHMDDDWPKARHHYEAMLSIMKRMAEVKGSSQDLEGYVNAVFKKIKDHEGEAAANQWLSDFHKSP